MNGARWDERLFEGFSSDEIAFLKEVIVRSARNNIDLGFTLRWEGEVDPNATPQEDWRNARSDYEFYLTMTQPQYLDVIGRFRLKYHAPGDEND